MCEIKREERVSPIQKKIRSALPRLARSERGRLIDQDHDKERKSADFLWYRSEKVSRLGLRSSGASLRI